MTKFRRDRIILPAIFGIVFLLLLLGSAYPITAAPSLLDWDTNPWPEGSLNRDYTGIGSPVADFNFTFSGDTGQLESGSPATNKVVTGGLTPAEDALFFAADFSSDIQSISLTIDISREVSSLFFLLMDVDHPQETGKDKVTVSGSDSLGATVIPQLIAIDSQCVSIVGNTATGQCVNPNNLSNGNVIVYFDSEINKILIEFQEGYTGSDPTSHGVAISDIHFDLEEIPFTNTPTATATRTATPTSTTTPTATATSTPTTTPTATNTRTPTATSIATKTSTPTVSPVRSSTPTLPAGPDSTPTPTPTTLPPQKNRFSIYFPAVIK